MLTKLKPSNVKKFYNSHKKKIVITTLAVTTAGTLLMFRNQRELNAWLKERGLLDEYYTPEDSY